MSSSVDDDVASLEGLRATGVAVRVVSTTPLLADLPESVQEPTTTEVELITGQSARTYGQWVRDHVEDFQ